ncbi:MAG: ribbon-helix-helix domain-containing protein [Solirubrobacteraceae bacterium]
MHKTSVYLDSSDVERLRRAAARTGRSQAELIREGVRLVTADTQAVPRAFHSLAVGHGGGAPYSGWDAAGLHRSVTGG